MVAWKARDFRSHEWTFRSHEWTLRSIDWVLFMQNKPNSVWSRTEAGGKGHGSSSSRFSFGKKFGMTPANIGTWTPEGTRPGSVAQGTNLPVRPTSRTAPSTVQWQTEPRTGTRTTTTIPRRATLTAASSPAGWPARGPCCSGRSATRGAYRRCGPPRCSGCPWGRPACHARWRRRRGPPA